MVSGQCGIGWRFVEVTVEDILLNGRGEELGLLGELQVRHFHEPSKRAPYSVDKVLRSSHSESLAD